ncbi:sugar transferase [candidate division WOR-3 bacterium]|nr:sugar transferase [candidate division WOR-3 bacterium]
MWKERDIAFLILDIAFTVLGVKVAYIFLNFFKFIDGYPYFKYNIFVIPILTIAIFSYTDMYNFSSYLDRMVYIFRTTKSIVYTFVAYLVVTLVFEIGMFHYRYLLFSLLLFLTLLVYIERTFLFTGILFLLPKKKVIIIKKGRSDLGVKDYFTSHKFAGISIIDVLDDVKEAEKYYGQNVIFVLVGGFQKFQELFSELKVYFDKKEKVILYTPLLKKIREIDYWFYLKKIPFVPFRWSGEGKMYLFLKRVVDVVFSVISIIMLSPLFLIIAFLIKVSSKGPVVFKQGRLTKNLNGFVMYKFRSMYYNIDDSSHKEYIKKLIKGENRKSKIYKMTRDNRITPIGYILRKTSLDELPQFFNVLKGDLSLVGPRPPLKYEIEEYKSWHKLRLKVKQGLTGFWQVFGRSLLPFDESVFLDIYYSFNRSIWMDLHIILQTIPNIVFGKGAY